MTIPCYNGAPWIGQALQSVIQDASEETEIIVVDDGSTDASATTIDKFASRIKHITIRNSGPGTARNVGLAASTNSKILFLDADDYIDGNYLSSMTAESYRSNAALVFGGYQVHDDSGARSSTVFLPKSDDSREALKAVLSGQFLQTACVLWDANFLTSIGAWRTDLFLGEDVELLIRALMRLPKISHNTDGHVVYRNHNGNNRLTWQASLTQLEAQYECSLPLAQMAHELSDPEILRLLGLQYFQLGRRAYVRDFPELGDRCLLEARKLGFRGYAGGRVERLLAPVLGLKHASRVARHIRSWRRRWEDIKSFHP